LKVIILTAGSGSRLKYGKPKSLVSVDERKLIDIQLSQLKLAEIGIEDITVITGYKSELFSDFKFKKIKNEKYNITNQMYSISLAKPYKNEKEVLIVYGDVLFEHYLIKDMSNSSFDFIVPSYSKFEQLWKSRGDTRFEDLETFEIGETSSLMQIGEKVIDINSVKGQFMGLVYFDNYKFKMFLENYELFNKENSYQKYMELQTTHFLNYLISRSIDIKILPYDGYFMELDSQFDLEIIQKGINF